MEMCLWLVFALDLSLRISLLYWQSYRPFYVLLVLYVR